MNERLHQVVLYVRDESKEFSITARKRQARLAEVNEQMAQQNYRRIVLQDNLSKQDAEELRDTTKAEYKTRGFKYQTRAALS